MDSQQQQQQQQAWQRALQQQQQQQQPVTALYYQPQQFATIRTTPFVPQQTQTQAQQFIRIAQPQPQQQQQQQQQQPQRVTFATSTPSYVAPQMTYAVVDQWGRQYVPQPPPPTTTISAPIPQPPQIPSIQYAAVQTLPPSAFSSRPQSISSKPLSSSSSKRISSPNPPMTRERDYLFNSPPRGALLSRHEFGVAELRGSV